MTAPRDAMVRNAADPAQVRRGKDKERLDDEQMHADLRTLLGTPAGRRYFTLLLNRTFQTQPIFVGSSEIYFRAGLHDWGLSLKRDLQAASLELFQLMEREAHDRTGTHG